MRRVVWLHVFCFWAGFPLLLTRGFLPTRSLQVASWAYAHLVDERNGEWWGYANRAGNVTHRFKGGPYKGCFHVPRALFYVDKILSAVLDG